MRVCPIPGTVLDTQGTEEDRGLVFPLSERMIWVGGRQTAKQAVTSLIGSWYTRPRNGREIQEVEGGIFQEMGLQPSEGARPASN